MTSINHSTDWSLYRDNLFRDIFQVARAYQTEMMRLLAEDRGHQHLRLSFRPVIMALPREGLRVTELAGQLHMSKQNCFGLLKPIESAGYVERRPDPDDQRARRVRLTARGELLLRDGLDAAQKVDGHCRELVGDAGFAELESAVSRLCRGLHFRPGDPDTLWRSAGPTRSTLSVDLIRLAEHCNGELMALTMARGHPELRPSHSQVLLHIGLQGSRIADIARINDVSKQAAGQLVAELEALGYLERAANPRDGRSRILFFTRTGYALIRDSVAAATELEGRCAALIGDAALRRLKAHLTTLYEGLTPRDPALAPAAPRRLRGPGESDAVQPLALALYVIAAWEGSQPSALALVRRSAGRLSLSPRALDLAASCSVDQAKLERRLQTSLGERKLATLHRLLQEQHDEPTP